MRRHHVQSALLLFAALAPAAPAAAATTDWVGSQHAAVRLISATDAVSGASPVEAGLEFRFAPGWHGYWRTPGDAGIAPVIDWSASPGLKTATVAWPAPTRLVVSDLQNSTYEGQVALPVALTYADPRRAADMRVSIDYAACSNVCVPYHADLSLMLPVGTAGPSAEAATIAAARTTVPGTPAAAGIEVARQAFVGTGAQRTLVVALRSSTIPFDHPDLFVENAGDGIPPAPAVLLGPDGRTATLTVPVAERPAADTASTDPASKAAGLALTLVDGRRSATFSGPAIPAAAPDGGGLWAVLLSALLGGTILNFMPCVLPVLSIKLVGLTRQAGAGRRAVRVGFAATGLGIVTSFLAIAAALVALKWSGATLGWGIQFQQPWFLAAMAALTVLFAASLFDWVHVGIPQAVIGLGNGTRNAAAGAGGRAAWIESFLTGAFATLMATPCSAPFVGTAVGFALARGPAEILEIFLGLGLGMALPFFAAAVLPGVAGWLPRPGPWMITLRRILGVLLLGTAAWLLAILWSVAGPGVTALVSLLLATMLALAAWAALRPSAEPRLWPKLATGSIVAAAVLAAVAMPSPGPIPPSGTAADGRAGEWQTFDPEAIERLVADGSTVLVDVSASWCLTCKVNELTALKTAEVRNRLSRPGTVVMRADWSRPDPAIARYIQGFGRYGIPLDVVYGPRRPAGEALSELLTARLVVEALDRASPAGDHAPASGDHAPAAQARAGAAP